MASFVFKIKYGDVLRRVTVPESLLSNGLDMTYRQLEDTIRQTFKIPSSSEIVVTYTDKDNDVVTMAGDQDLHDACILQGLNPLRLTVTLVPATPEPATGAQASPGRWGPHNRHGRSGRLQNLPDLKNLVDTTMKFSQETAKQTSDHVTQVLHAFEPLIKGAPKMVVNEAIESLLKAFSSQPGPLPKDGLKAPLLAPMGPYGHPCNSSQCPAPPPIPSPIGPCGDGEFGSCTKFMDGSTATSADEKNGNCVYHHGVQCDVCKMCPIVGTRYKSNKKHDYDLCRSCFQEFGSADDYTQIDRPLWRPRHLQPLVTGGRMMRGMRCPANPSYYGGRMYMRGPHMHAPHMHAPHMHALHGNHGPYGGKGDSRCGGPAGGAGGKLDARFVQDVTIFDGTELAPGTPFTKIWRLRNSGTLVWPKDTQLVHVGGDELGSVYAVTVELPEEGLAQDGEVEVSVDLVAPEKPGRYVSHWRLVAPAGPKFGHRVWVLIQVVPKDEQSPQMMESLASTQEGGLESGKEVEVLAPETVGVSVEPLAVTNGSAVQSQLEDEVFAPENVSIHFVDDLIALEAEPVAVQPQLESSAVPEKIEYPEIKVGPFAPLMLEEPAVDDAGKSQEDNSAVESGELGLFSMVEMPTAEVPAAEVPQQQAATHQSSYETLTGPQVMNVVEGSGLQYDKFAEGMAAYERIMYENSADNKFPEGLAAYERIKFGNKNSSELGKTEKERLKAAAEVDSVDAMLATLEAMGFKQRSLNTELLKKNKYDMQRTLDDLVAAAEWDPMLEELEEMGFYDTDMNRRLMFKNNGSVKRVVKELVQMYKDPAGKGKEQM